MFFEKKKTKKSCCGKREILELCCVGVSILLMFKEVFLEACELKALQVYDVEEKS